MNGVGHSRACLRGTPKSVLLNWSCHKNNEYIWFRGGGLLGFGDIKHFFTSEKPKKYHAWSCQNECDALTFL